MKKDILVLGSSDDLDLGEEAPGDEEENGDADAGQKAEVDVEQDREEEGRDPNDGLRLWPPGVADKVPELRQDAEEWDDDDGRQDGLEGSKHWGHYFLPLVRNFYLIRFYHQVVNWFLDFSELLLSFSTL